MAELPEITAEHFEAIRKNLFQLVKEKMLFGGADLNATFDAWHYPATYAPGAVVAYANDIWITASELVNDPTPPDESGAWRQAADWRKYDHYDFNSGRFVCLGDGGSGYSLVSACQLFPRQMIPTKQIWGFLEHTWPKLYWKDDTAHLSGVYKECTQTHVSDNTFNPAFWRTISVKQARRPLPHRQSVEFNINQITGVIGAIYPYPRNPTGGPPPWYYNYYMYPQNQPDNGSDEQRYYNPKISTAYQAAVEYYVSVWGGGWTGGPRGHEEWAGHALGTGIDPALPAEPLAWDFNRSAFEELLYLRGSYDWYLDLNFAPGIGPGENGYDVMGCWRRTWKYAMDYPYGIGSATRVYYLKFNSQPDVSSYITIDKWHFQFADTLANPDTYTDSEGYPQTAPYETGSNYVRVLIADDWFGGGVDGTAANLAMAISNSKSNAYAEDAGGEGLIKISVLYEAGEMTWLGQTHLSQQYLFSTGGLYSMWPGEWGNPPQVNWRDPDEIIDMIQLVEDTWNTYSEEYRNTFITRHTLNFEPFQPYYHPELINNIISDMDGVLGKCLYRVVTPVIEGKTLSWECAAQGSSNLFDTFEAAAAFANDGGRWVEPEDWGLYGTVGFESTLAADTDPSDYLLRASVSSISGYGVKLHMVSEALYNRGYRSVAVIMELSNSISGGGSNGFDSWKTSSGNIWRQTEKYLTTALGGAAIKCDQVTLKHVHSHITIPIVSSAGSSIGASFYPSPHPSFFPHGYNLPELSWPDGGWQYMEICFGLALFGVNEGNALVVANPRGVSLT